MVIAHGGHVEERNNNREMWWQNSFKNVDLKLWSRFYAGLL